jgi:hypothetical protein
MAGIYKLSREGGARSPRFTEYTRLAPNILGLSGYNPMAGPHAAETIQSLLDMDAESIAGQALAAVQARCEYAESIEMALVVASAGMWTDRLATEVKHRTSPHRDRNTGLVLLWTGEPVTEADVRREAAAEAARVVWSAFHGDANSAGQVLAREGFASALAIDPSGTAEVDEKTGEAARILSDHTNLGDITAFLYGDAAALELGYTALGLPDHAGFHWAIAQATRLIKKRGVPEAIRATGNLLSQQELSSGVG